MNLCRVENVLEQQDNMADEGVANKLRQWDLESLIPQVIIVILRYTENSWCPCENVGIGLVENRMLCFKYNVLISVGA